jgi:hypothetical protein
MLKSSFENRPFMAIREQLLRLGDRRPMIAPGIDHHASGVLGAGKFAH